MRTTLLLDDVLLARARRVTGIAEKTALVHAGLEALIAREGSAAAGGAGRHDAAGACSPATAFPGARAAVTGRGIG